mgnify:CR=1 FL=1
MAKQIAQTSTKPNAWIVSSNDRGRKSIKNGKVFLTDGDEFEIELFNPLTVSVLADIKLNGQSISKTGRRCNLWANYGRCMTMNRKNTNYLIAYG